MSVRARAAAAAALVLGASGCGGGSASSGPGRAAALVPADAVAFVALDTSVPRAQARAAALLLRALPVHDPLVGRLRRALAASQGLPPALGDELDLAALPGSPPRLVVLARPRDDATLRGLLGGGLASRPIGDWTAVARSAAALRALAQVTTPLTDSNVYGAAMSTLTRRSVARAYTDGRQAQRLLISLPGQVTDTAPFRGRGRGIGPGRDGIAAERFAWGAAEVVAAGHAVRLAALTRAAPPTQDAVEHAGLVQLRTDAYAPLLPDEIPAGATFVLDYRASPGAFENAAPGALPGFVRKLAAASRTLTYDLDSVLGGETAIYARGPAELTLVTQPADVDTAISNLPELVAELQPALPSLGRLGLRHAVIGGQLVVSTSTAGIAAFRSSGAKLSADTSFRDALEAAGAPQLTTGFLYAQPGPLPPLVRALLGELDPGGAVVAYGTHAGADSSYTLYLGGPERLR